MQQPRKANISFCKIMNLDKKRAALSDLRACYLELNWRRLGVLGTTVGTGINTFEGFAEAIAEEVTKMIGTEAGRRRFLATLRNRFKRDVPASCRLRTFNNESPAAIRESYRKSVRRGFQDTAAPTFVQFMLLIAKQDVF